MIAVGIVTASPVISVSANVQSIRAISDLLLQAVTVLGDKTAEGRLIEAIAIPWFDIIALLQKDPNIAFQIPPNKWEELIAGAYHKSGFEEVTLTPRSGDHGRDVIAVKRGLGSIRVIDQVKAYKRGHLVTAHDVRALMGVLHGDGASKGFLTTTSDFAPRLRSDPLIAPWIPSRIELINGTALFSRLAELAAGQKKT
jgi:restriction system protein